LKNIDGNEILFDGLEIFLGGLQIVEHALDEEAASPSETGLALFITRKPRVE